MLIVLLRCLCMFICVSYGVITAISCYVYIPTKAKRGTDHFTQQNVLLCDATLSFEAR